MKKYILTLALFFVFTLSHAQSIKKAQIKLSADGKDIRFMELVFDNGYAVGIKDCREVAYVELEQGNTPVYNLYAIGLDVKYYDHFDIHDPQGKIKSIGNVVFKYNNVFDIHEVFGTLKLIGDIEIKYYNVFDMSDAKESVKSVGNVQVSYYGRTAPDDRIGEISSVTGNSETLRVVGPRRKGMGRFDWEEWEKRN